MKIKQGFSKKNIAGTVIVVPTGSNAYSFNGMITLNETGEFLWECFCSDISCEKAVELLCAEYDVDEYTARSDIDAFISKLTENGILE